MTGGWFRRIFHCKVGRIEALERELNAMRTALATIVHQIPLEAERAQHFAQGLNDLRVQLSSIESRASIEQNLLRNTTEDVRQLRERAQADRDELMKMRTALSRVEREFEHSVHQAREAATGLLQRIESVRRARTNRECPRGWTEGRADTET